MPEEAQAAGTKKTQAVPFNHIAGYEMANGKVAETFDAFGNKVAGTSVRVRAPPGGASSITF